MAEIRTSRPRRPDLCERRWQGVDLGEDEYVIRADEKSQLQALRRRHRGLPARTGPQPDAWSSSTAVAERWPTSPPSTSTVLT